MNGNGRNFRVILNLSSFFHDHRCVARMFINDNIETIQQLKHKIKNIFGIKHFHLTSENHFLPPLEDVRVLRNDEMVWAVPHKMDHHIINHSTSHKNEQHIYNGSPRSKKRHIITREPNTDVTPRKKKKRRNATDENSAVITDENSAVITQSQQIVKKHKKTKLTGQEMTRPSIENDAISRNEFEKKNRKHKTNHLDQNLNELNDKPTKPVKESTSSCHSESLKMDNVIPRLQSHINSCNKSGISQNTSQSSSSSVGLEKDKTSCTGHLINYKRYTPIPTVTNDYLANKKINIVQIDIVKSEEVSINPKYPLVDDKNNSTDRTASSSNSVEEINSSIENGFVRSIVKDIEKRLTPEISSISDKEGENYVQDENPCSKMSAEKIRSSNSFTSVNTPLTSTSTISALLRSTPNTYEIARCRPLSQYLNSSTPNLDPQKLFLAENTESHIFSVKDLEMPSVNGTIPEMSVEMQVPIIIPDVSDIKPEDTKIEDVSSRENTRIKDVSSTEHSDKLSALTSELRNNYDCNLSAIEVVNDRTNVVGTKPKQSNATDSEISFKINRKRPGFMKTSRIHSGIGSLLSTLRSDKISNSNFSDASQSESFNLKLSPTTESEIAKTGIDPQENEVEQNADSSFSLTTDGSHQNFSNESSTRRRRVRKRKKKVNTTEQISSPLLSQTVVIQRNVSSPKPMHIRFDHPDVEDQENDNSVILLSDEEKKSEFKKNLLKEEFIQSSPLMTDIVPKVQDIIAFKVLRMGINYTPQISTNVIGKVVDFNRDDGAVTIEILHGLDQCEEPNGKLTLNTECREIQAHTRAFNWADLKEPRLLYP